MKYCDNCNYEYSDLEVETARYNFDCPRCKTGCIRLTYSVGSKIHREILNGERRQYLNRGMVPPLTD